MSIRRSELPAYNTLELGRTLSDTLHLELDGYMSVEEANELNRFVPENAKRVFIPSDMMTKHADGRWETTTPKWRALELLQFELTYSLIMGRDEEDKEIYCKRTFYVAAHDYNCAIRIAEYELKKLMSCGLIAGWRNY